MSQNLTDIGGIAYFFHYISDYLPYTMISVLGSILGLVGNLLIIGTVISSKELYSSTNILIFNLAVADLIISILVEPFTIIGVFLGKNFFSFTNHGLCEFVAAMCLVACETSLMNIGFLAFNRYIHICHTSYYSTWFTTKKTLIYCGITWSIGVLIDLPNIFGWGGHYYDEKTLSCVWNRLASLSYSLFFPLSSIVAPCIVILLCYLRIFWYVRKANNKVFSENSFQERLKSRTKSVQVAKGLFISFIIFTICWLPYGMVVMTDFSNQLPRSAHMFTMAIAHLNSSLNPILYGIFNSAFKKGYSDFLRKILFMKSLNHLSKTGVTVLNKHDLSNSKF